MCKLVGGDKVLLPLNSEHVLSFTYLSTKDNSPFVNVKLNCNSSNHMGNMHHSCGQIQATLFTMFLTFTTKFKLKINK